MKFKKFKTALLASVMTLAICLGMTGTAFAADPVTGTEETPAAAALTKELQMPEGTTVPAATFYFDFTKVSGATKTDPATLTAMPDLSTSLAIASGTKTTAAGVDTYTLNTGNFLSGKTFPTAGEYVYTVAERKTGTGVYAVDAAKETLTYSGATYEVHVYVANGTTAGTTYVKAVSAIALTDQTGTPVTGDAATAKVDPTVPTTTGEGNDFKFVNKYVYVKGGGVDPTDPTGPTVKALDINKIVAGDLGSQTEYFDFTLNLANSSLVTTASYKAYICTFDGTAYTKVSATEANNQYTGTDFIDVTVGTPKVIKLKHNQHIVFMDLPVGNTYMAKETGVAGYTGSIALLTNGAASAIPGTTAGADVATGSTATLLGALENKATFTNTYADIVPTGIIINNLPFFIMILVAMGGLTGYIVMKRRNKEER